MRRYALELSGEHETLPKSEALALLELYSGGYRVVSSLDQCLVVDATDLDVQALGRRLAMTHRIMEVMVVSQAALPDIESSLEAALVAFPLPRQSYRVRVRRVKDAPLKGYEVEKAAGGVLFRSGYRADLRSPEMELRGVITGEVVVLGLEVFRIDRSSFEGRRPHLKPFFYPGVLMPRVARALVNLSQAEEGEILLDPFSGTGGILVEACLAGLKGVGVDVQEKLVSGAVSNLRGLDFSLLVGDAKGLPFKDESVDAVVTDPPYGRSAVVRAGSRDELLVESLAEIVRVLKSGRRMVVVADREIGRMLKDAGFRISEIHVNRVHRSLTRHVYLCLK